MAVSAFGLRQRGDGAQRDFQMEPKAPVLDVFEVKRHVGVEGRIATRGDLPQASETRFHVEAAKVLDVVTLEVVNGVGTRAYKAHVATQDVPELRDFVEAQLAQPPPARGDAGIIGELEDGTGSLVC